MIKFVALYKKPADEAAFLRHYQEVHTPLVLKTPGLARLEVTRFTRSPQGGEPAFFLMAEMYYPDLATYKAAMKSPENAAAGQDLMKFAGDVVTLLQGEMQPSDQPEAAVRAASGQAGPVRPAGAGHTPDPGQVMARQQEMDREGKTASGASELADQDRSFDKK